MDVVNGHLQHMAAIVAHIANNQDLPHIMIVTVHTSLHARKASVIIIQEDLCNFLQAEYAGREDANRLHICRRRDESHLTR